MSLWSFRKKVQEPADTGHAQKQYNGKKERSIRDVKSYERTLRRSGLKLTLRQRLDEIIHDLNEERPRPVLGGRTAREVFTRTR